MIINLPPQITTIKTISPQESIPFGNRISVTKESPVDSIKFNGLWVKKVDKDDPYTEYEARKGAKLIERGLRSTEYAVRRGMNKIGERKAKDFIETALEFLKDIDINSPKYMFAIGEMCAVISRQIETEINLESGIIDDIVDSDEACIFIMNHNDQKNDPALMATFAHQMYIGYLKAGKIETAPRPKVILNEDILRAQSEGLREIYTKMGAVGVDADIADTDKASRTNLKTMLPVIRGFNNDENHIFIFPEGRFSAFRERKLRTKFTKMNDRAKFQPGVGDIIYATAKKKKRVKVIPLGLAARERFRPGLKRFKKWKTPLGSIHMGKPIYITMKDGHLYATSDHNLDELKKEIPGISKRFFDLEEDPNFDFKDIINPETDPKNADPEESSEQPMEETQYLEKDGITYKLPSLGGEPVIGRNMNSRVISGILYAHLKTCKELAKAALPKKPELFDKDEPETQETETKDTSLTKTTEH